MVPHWVRGHEQLDMIAPAGQPLVVLGLGGSVGTSVDVGGKEITRRVAIAEGAIRMSATTLAAILKGEAPKGGVLTVSQLAGVMAAKRTADLIPLCHPLALSSVRVSLEPDEAKYRWLVAASWDRIMTTQLQPQWYGTQFQSTPDGMFLYPVADGAVSDQDRQAMGVPTLAESRDRLAEMARMNGLEVDPTPPTIEQLRDARRIPDRGP